MKTISRNALLCLAMLAFTAACSTESISKDKADDKTVEQQLITFQTEGVPTSRTSMTHTLNGPGKFMWTANDNLWIDNAGTFVSSLSNDITSATPFASFFFSNSSILGYYNYVVTYTGENTTKGDEVTISTLQMQTVPNDFSHLGKSGDCGTALATRNGQGIYKFQLEHKAAYLCFLPRTKNDVFKQCKLIKIELFSDNNLAGTYALTSTGLSSSPTSGASTSITLTTGAAGFPLTNENTDLATNAAYMVIAPGQHAFTIKYWIKGADGTTGTITKTIASDNYAANTITDLTANFDTNAFDSKYYMWDAQEDMWHGVEANQPTTNGATGTNGITSNTDPRAYRPQKAGDVTEAAINKSKYCPNVAELDWYINRGQPHWDDEEIWTVMGKLYKGGLWLLRKANIPGFSSNTFISGAAYYHNYRWSLSGSGNAAVSPIAQGKPDATSVAKYFYLPALGIYKTSTGGGSLSGTATLQDVGTTGYYMTSTGHFNFSANDYLKFNSSGIETFYGVRWNGERLWTAE